LLSVFRRNVENCRCGRAEFRDSGPFNDIF